LIFLKYTHLLFSTAHYRRGVEMFFRMTKVACVRVKIFNLLLSSGLSVFTCQFGGSEIRWDNRLKEYKIK